MKHNDYMEKRNGLIAEAEAMLNEGNMEEYEAKTQEVRDLDETYDNISKERANIAALREQKIEGEQTIKVEQIENIDITNKTNTIEYRKAFMAYVLGGKYKNADANTLTTDVASVIPDVLINRVVTKMEATGMIWSRITKTMYKAGVTIPTSAFSPTAEWVGEGESTDEQKATTGSVTFTQFKLRCEVSISAEVDAMALSAFENMIVDKIAEAMVYKIEDTILSTNAGTAAMKGIFAETPTTGQALTAITQTYEGIVAAEAALPQQYEANAVWLMTKKTFMGYIGMVDDSGQPVARVNYGIGGKPERFLLGREVVLVGDYMSSYASGLADTTIFAAIFDLRQYAANTVYDLGMMKKRDWDTEDILTKAVMSLDGKVVDKRSLVTIAKASA